MKIVLAFEKAEKEGIGAVAVDSKMIDPPVFKRALKSLERAVEAGRLAKNWRDIHEY
jgi:citrate lyase subunit beta/citryl-CoA lyase